LWDLHGELDSRNNFSLGGEKYLVLSEEKMGKNSRLHLHANVENINS